MEEKARAEKPKLIIAGASAYSREWDYARFRKVADEIGAIFMVDMAHPAGLIAAGLLENPLKHAHIVTTTTHKTLRGPRGGMILMGKDFDNPWGKKTPKGEIKKMSALLDSAVFPGVQGGPLEHVIAAKAVAFGEALQPEWKEYMTQVKKNADALATALIARGYKIISDGTDNHCRHHGQQEHGALRHPQPVPHQRPPLRHSCHHNPWRERGTYGDNRRTHRPCAHQR